MVLRGHATLCHGAQYEVSMKPPKGKGDCIVGFSATSATISGHVQLVRQARRRYADLSDGSRPGPQPLLSGVRFRGQLCFPSEVEELLLDLVLDGFVGYCCGPRSAPTALVAAYQWQDYVDLVTIRHIERVTTARVPVPQHGRVDVFDPGVVVWAYEGPPQCALPALLNLVHPQHPDAPVGAYPAPASLHVPRVEQRPMTIRLPSPDQAGIRAARLAAAMTAGGSDPIMAYASRRGATEVFRCR